MRNGKTLLCAALFFMMGFKYTGSCGMNGAWQLFTNKFVAWGMGGYRPGNLLWLTSTLHANCWLVFIRVFIKIQKSWMI